MYKKLVEIRNESVKHGSSTVTGKIKILKLSSRDCQEISNFTSHRTK